MKPTREDIYCGLHSGFPLCCIAFYVAVWSYVMDIPFPRLRYRLGDLYIRLSDRVYGRDRRGFGLGYVPCPVCMARKKKVKVIGCNCQGEQ